jgi:serine/threonine-protein kinase
MHDPAQVRQRLIECAVMTAETIDAHLARWRSEKGGEGSGADFLEWLVDQQMITDFQRDAVLAGHAVPSFQVGPYRVYEMVAVGELGSVFRAVHQEHQQPVSLKLYPTASADAATLANIRRELRVSIETSHPNVLRCYEVGQAGGAYFLALEDLDGETLQARLRRQGYLSLPEACRIGRDVACALEHLHANDIVHRNVRPANIWISKDGSAKLMDFGRALDAFAAVDLEDGPTPPVKVLEDYTYASPEQARDPDTNDRRTDIYSLGATLYDCLAGRPPFEARHPIRQVVCLLCDEPEPLSALNESVPPAFDDALAGLLAKSPDARFQKAKHVVFALDQFVPLEADGQSPATNVSPEYMDYVLSKQAADGQAAEGGQEMSPEQVAFLQWMSSLKAVPNEERPQA